ncbi:MAG: hypothetical protein SGCHY_000330 [Lobulomycetales sp.]
MNATAAEQRESPARTELGNESKGVSPGPNVPHSLNTPTSPLKTKRHSALRVSAEYGSQAYGIQTPLKGTSTVAGVRVADVRGSNVGGMVASDSVWSAATSFGTSIVNGLDAVGEKLADALGITTPRYAEYMQEAEQYQRQTVGQPYQDQQYHNEAAFPAHANPVTAGEYKKQPLNQAPAQSCGPEKDLAAGNQPAHLVPSVKQAPTAINPPIPAAQLPPPNAIAYSPPQNSLRASQNYLGRDIPPQPKTNQSVRQSTMDALMSSVKDVVNGGKKTRSDSINEIV